MRREVAVARRLGVAWRVGESGGTASAISAASPASGSMSPDGVSAPKESRLGVGHPERVAQVPASLSAAIEELLVAAERGFEARGHARSLSLMAMRRGIPRGLPYIGDAAFASASSDMACGAIDSSTSRRKACTRAEIWRLMTCWCALVTSSSPHVTAVPSLASLRVDRDRRAMRERTAD